MNESNEAQILCVGGAKLTVGRSSKHDGGPKMFYNHVRRTRGVWIHRLGDIKLLSIQRLVKCFSLVVFASILRY